MQPLHILANQTLDRCGSTNDIAKQLAEAGLPHGTWVSTRIQETGRGRLGRKWESYEGNLFLSMIARIQDKPLWSWVPLTTAVAITRFLRNRYSGFNFQIKWPNDLWLGSRKLGGILCEGVSTYSQNFIIIGVGINCLHSPEGLDQNTIDLTTALGRGPVLADDIRPGVIGAILNEITTLVSEGPTTIQNTYENWASFPKGTEIEWGSPSQTGQIEGLGSSSELCVKTIQAGQVQRLNLFAEDVKIRSLRRS